MGLMQIAFIFFAAVASGGVLMLGLILARVNIPAFLGPAHGLGGFAALGLLLAANLQSAETPARAWWALAVFFGGFLGGLLFFKILYPKSAPAILAAAHGSIAVLGLYLLYGVAF